jgi:hypothetical protein
MDVRDPRKTARGDRANSTSHPPGKASGAFCVLFQAFSAMPCRARFRAMGNPMVPNPMKPTFSMIHPILLFVQEQHGTLSEVFFAKLRYEIVYF